jgi:predicted membrane metal-binding protein
MWAILVFVLVLWLIGLLADVAGGFIHLLLIVAGIIFVIKLFSGRRPV